MSEELMELCAPSMFTFWELVFFCLLAYGGGRIQQKVKHEVQLMEELEARRKGD